jgi:Protein of unknown function (DUF3311)
VSARETASELSVRETLSTADHATLHGKKIAHLLDCGAIAAGVGHARRTTMLATSWRDGRNAMDGSESRRSAWSWWYLLFVVQFVGALWPPFYNSIEPQWLGVPFFYWSQLAMVIIGAVLTAIVYFATDA